MSDLLGIGMSGVSAYRTALSAIGDNVANAETPGYARREVRLREAANAGSRDPVYVEAPLFGGVEAASVDRAWDAFRAADARFTAGAAGRAETREQWLTSVETALDDGPAGVGSLLGAFFNSAVSLAAAPDDRLGRSAMLSTLDQAAGAFRTTANTLSRVADGITNAAGIEIKGLNDDLAALAEVNRGLRQAAPGRASRAALEDERDRLIDSVAKRIDVHASLGTDGTVTLTLANAAGVSLLDFSQRSVVTMVSAADGRISLQLATNGTTVPLPATSGTLAGLVDVAASTADKRQGLDSLAQDFATAVNNWSAQGLDPNGNPGGALLAVTAGAISLKAVTSDPDAIAAASTDGTPNGNLLALDALRGNSGVEARWAAMVAGQAQQLAAAKSEATAASNRRDNAFAARDEIVGVDLDHEAAELIRFQQAYSGAAKVIQVARDTVQAILDIL